MGFLQKMRVENTLSMTARLRNSVIYEPSAVSQFPIGVVLKAAKNGSFSVTERMQTSAERFLNASANVVDVVLVTASSTAIFTSATLSTCYLDKLGLPLMIYFIRLFNILDIASNLSKINVKFSERLQHAMNFINDLELPGIDFLAKLSILDDQSFDRIDVDGYSLYIRGNRGKMAESNSEVFLAHGQNFVISMSIIVLRIVLSFLGTCLKEDSRILGVVAYFYHLLIGTYF